MLSKNYRCQERRSQSEKCSATKDMHRVNWSEGRKAKERRANTRNHKISRYRLKAMETLENDVSVEAFSLIMIINTAEEFVKVTATSCPKIKIIFHEEINSMKDKLLNFWDTRQKPGFI